MVAAGLVLTVVADVVVERVPRNVTWAGPLGRATVPKSDARIDGSPAVGAPPGDSKGGQTTRHIPAHAPAPCSSSSSRYSALPAPSVRNAPCWGVRPTRRRGPGLASSSPGVELAGAVPAAGAAALGGGPAAARSARPTARPGPVAVAVAGKQEPGHKCENLAS